MRQSSFKKGLGTGEDATRRHVELKRATTKEQRDEKMQKRRVGGTGSGGAASGSTLPQLISTLSLSVDALPTLYRILHHPESDHYYEPSTMYPEITGPYLFEMDQPLVWLISLLTRNAPIEMLRIVTGCFYNISAHEKQGTYVPRLIRLGLVERLVDICRLDNTIYEYSVETLSNMCLDNAESRNYVTASGIMHIVSNTMDNWQHINIAATFLRAIFGNGNNLPNSAHVKELWGVLTHKVLFEHFPDGESAAAGKSVNGFSALTNILRCIYFLARESEAYRSALVNDDSPLMNQLIIYCKAGLLAAAHILTELTKDIELHPKLTSLIPVFVHQMNTREVGLIIEGAHGLANLSESPESFPMICHDHVLQSLRMQFEYREVSAVLSLARQAIAWIIISAPDPDAVFPKMEPFICRMAEALVTPGDNTVIMRTLDALERLVKWNKEQIVPLFEMYDVTAQLTRLQHYGTNAMQERVIQLTDWIETGAEYMSE
jgi:hypothetical protein